MRDVLQTDLTTLIMPALWVLSPILWPEINLKKQQITPFASWYYPSVTRFETARAAVVWTELPSHPLCIFPLPNKPLSQGHQGSSLDLFLLQHSGPTMEWLNR